MEDQCGRRKKTRKAKNIADLRVRRNIGDWAERDGWSYDATSAGTLAEPIDGDRTTGETDDRKATERVCVVGGQVGDTNPHGRGIETETFGEFRYRSSRRTAGRQNRRNRTDAREPWGRVIADEYARPA